MKTFNQWFCLAPIFQSGMVLQRDKDIHVWGNALPGVKVTISLADRSSTVITSQDGVFQAILPPMKASRNETMIVSCDAPGTCPIELHSVHIGDVWLAGGQSNMEFFLRYDEDWEQCKQDICNPDIHMYNVPQKAFEGHTSHNKGGYGYWFQEGENGFDMFSAPGYSFAKHLQPYLQVPIGIIGCNWGGTTAASWVPESVLQAPPLVQYLKEYQEAIHGTDPHVLRRESLKAWAFEDSLQHGRDFEPLLYGRSRSWQLAYLKQHATEPVIPMGPYNINRPCGLYHTMLQELIPFSIKGVLWYQGESDAGYRSRMYGQLLSSLIRQWRKDWNDTFPFLFVQLAPFGNWLDCTSDGYREVREQQQLVADTVESAYMTSIMDLGSYYDIHPKSKMEVGRRLALLARGHVYDEKDLLCDSPRLVDITHPSKGVLELSFSSSRGLHIDKEDSDLVLLADNHPVTPDSICIVHEKIQITFPESLEEKHPFLSVSLGWADFSQIYIRNEQGLPIAPFQTSIQL